MVRNLLMYNVVHDASYNSIYTVDGTIQPLYCMIRNRRSDLRTLRNWMTLHIVSSSDDRSTVVFVANNIKKHILECLGDRI
jgi:hypothetical protein